MSKKLDKGVYDNQTITVGGQSISIRPETLQQFDYKGCIFVSGIRPHKKKSHPDAKSDDVVLHVCINAQLDLSVDQAKDIIGEYTIGALCARVGDIASVIKFSGRIGDMKVRLLDGAFELEEVAFEGISINIIRRHIEESPSHWMVRLNFKFSFVPPIANAFSILSEYVCERIGFECMPMQSSFEFGDEEWQELAVSASLPEEPAKPVGDGAGDTPAAPESDNQTLDLEGSDGGDGGGDDA